MQSVDWSTESAKASLIEENVAQKFDILLGFPTSLLFFHYVVFFFFFDLIASYNVLGFYEVTMLT